MSADNGIYVAKFPDGWRVGYAMDESIHCLAPNSSERKLEIRRVFGNSKIYASAMEAFQAAHEWAQEFAVLEYGVCELGELENF